MRRFIVLMLLAAIVLAAIPLYAQETSEPRFETTPCVFEVPEGYVVDCGNLIVPELRIPSAADSANTIRVAFARIRSRATSPALDPLIYLDGGPGGHTLVSGDVLIDYFDPFLDRRDVILFDQRGVGFSEPALDCPEAAQYFYAVLDGYLSPEEDAALNVPGNIDLFCRDRLVDQGVNLSAYNSRENAADVADLARALGYSQINLLGVSYGTRLGLTIMRDHPGVVRSAILDAVYPPQVNLFNEIIRNADRAFTTLFEGCAASPECGAAYPDLEQVFYDLVDDLNASPQTDWYYDDYTDTDYEVQVDGYLLINQLFGSLYSTTLIPSLPQAIYDAAEGNYAAFVEGSFYSLWSQQFFSTSMYDAVQCYEEAAFSSVSEALAIEGDFPQVLRDFYFGSAEYTYYICDSYGLDEADPLENEAVRASMPTLVTVGEYDPITPPAWAIETAAKLPFSFYYEYPGVGHSAYFGSECARRMALQFVEMPTVAPESACLDQMKAPAFRLPGQDDPSGAVWRPFMLTPGAP